MEVEVKNFLLNTVLVVLIIEYYRTLQLAKSSHRINALMNENGPGLLPNRRRKPNFRKDAGNGFDGDQEEEDGKFKLFTSPAIRIYQLESIIEASIGGKLAEDEDNRLYDPVRAKLMVQALSKDIRNQVKELNCNRYRIVAVVSIVEKRLQSMDYKMVFCIDAHLDYYATYKFESAEYYIVATVYMMYKDWNFNNAMYAVIK